MDADWYVDPLDRFDGRFFDGKRWTERVSNNGQLAIDPEFTVQIEAGERPKVTSDTPRRRVDVPAEARPVAERRAIRPNLPAADIAESPVRTAAVLDTLDGEKTSASPSRRYLLWGLLGLVAALAVVALLLLRGDGPSPAAAESVDLANEQAQRVDDLEAGGVDDGTGVADIEELEVDAPPGAVSAGATFAANERIDVGALRVLNGTSVLRDLEEWHQGFAADRGVELSSEARCWFGQLGGAAVQVAHCGPVGGSAETEYLYDGVPLAFEDVPGGQIAQPVVDAAVIDEVLANALILVGPNSPD